MQHKPVNTEPQEKSVKNAPTKADSFEKELGKLPDAVQTILVNELHSIASHYMRNEQAGHTLQATALVNEAYLKLAGKGIAVNDKHHFIAIAAQQMRRILVDHARQKMSLKRGGDLLMVTLNDDIGFASNHNSELIYLDRMLEELASFDTRASRIFELRLFSSLSNPNIAKLLNLSLTTVERDLKAAKAWLKVQIAKAENEAN